MYIPEGEHDRVSGGGLQEPAEHTVREGSAAYPAAHDRKQICRGSSSSPSSHFHAPWGTGAGLAHFTGAAVVVVVDVVVVGVVEDVSGRIVVEPKQRSRSGKSGPINAEQVLSEVLNKSHL